MSILVSQHVNETLGLSSTPTVRSSQEVREALGYSSTPGARLSQLVTEALGSASAANVRTTQQVLEALGFTTPGARISQIVLEILVVNWEKEVLPIYPTLDGLTYDVEWEPGFFNLSDTTVTGANVVLGMSQYPLHTFTLVYSVLRNGFMFDPQTYGGTEFATLMGFFLQTGGTLGRFVFLNPDDNTVVGQSQGVTDGVAHAYTLYRTFGVPDYNGTEPIGVVNLTQPFNLYLDTVLVDPTDYDILTTDPCVQQVDFHVTPTAGKAITTDMSYYYYCQLPSDTLSFRKFMQKLWDLGEIKIHSCRPGA